MSTFQATVYLGGYITSSEDQSWKEEARFLFGLVDIRVLDPLLGRQAKDVDWNSSEVVIRDLQLIEKSDILLFNLPGAFLGVSWGCPMEIFHAWYNLKKPVIVVGQSKVIMAHPWLRACVTRVLPSLADAVDYIHDLWVF